MRVKFFFFLLTIIYREISRVYVYLKTNRLRTSKNKKQKSNNTIFIYYYYLVPYNITSFPRLGNEDNEREYTKATSDYFITIFFLPQETRDGNFFFYFYTVISTSV